MKKIGILMDSMPIGGVEKALISLLNCFDYDRYEVILWLEDKSGELFDQINEHVKVRYWKDFNQSEDYNIYLKSLVQSKKWFTSLVSISNRILNPLLHVRDDSFLFAVEIPIS